MFCSKQGNGMVNRLKAGVLVLAVGFSTLSHGQGLDDLTITEVASGEIALAWTNDAVLQTSSNLNHWLDLRSATSPSTHSIGSATGFFKLRLPDYTFFGSYDSEKKNVALLDYDKDVVHVWSNDVPGGANGVYLLEDGSIIRAGQAGNTVFNVGGSGGRLERRDWNSNVLWSFDYSSSTYCQHHDFEILPNGNLVLIVWEYLSQAEAIERGRDPALIGTSDSVWSEALVEIQPMGSNDAVVVWEWRAIDHLVQDFDSGKANYGNVSNHHERADFNYAAKARTPDWLHINSVSYNAELDQLMVSVPSFNEIWIIDHSTTTEEAASHNGGNSGRGGDLLYRWGNPAAYDTGTAGDQVFGFQHNATWIPDGYPGAGNILVFNNGQHRLYSSVDEVIPPLLPDGSYEKLPGQPYGPTGLSWTYEADPPTSFYASRISGAQRLPSGNTLVCDGTASTFLEVEPDGTIAWEHWADRSPPIYRATRVFFRIPE